MLSSCKIAIIGNGLVGMIAALKFAAIKPDLMPIDPFKKQIILIGPENSQQDMRTTALMLPAIQLLRDLGIWEELQHYAAPLKTIRIIDDTKYLIHSPTTCFHAAEIEEEAFGYNIKNIDLHSILSQWITKSPNICKINQTVTTYLHETEHVTLSLDDHSKLKAQLVIAADGRHSLARKSAAITDWKWHYPQTALVTNFSHSLPHDGISTEIYTSEGPLTQVPLLNNNSSLVWVMKPEKAAYRASLSKELLETTIEQAMQSFLGEIHLHHMPQSWPIHGMISRHFSAYRTILIGESAHVLPPIGAQGLNLSIRDILDLATTLSVSASQQDLTSFDPGAKHILDTYHQSRKFDIGSRTLVTHTLNMGLLSAFLPLQMIRYTGLSLARNLPFFRKFLFQKNIHIQNFKKTQ